MAGRQLGDAYITISPDTRLFRSLTDAQIRKELAGFNPKVRIGADTKGAQTAITAFQTRIAALSKQLSGLRADAQTKDAESKIAGVQARVLTLAKQMKNLTMSADARKLDAQIAGEVAKLKGLQLQMSSLQADADTKRAASRILDLQKQAFHLQESLDKGKLKANIDVKAAEAKIKSIDAELRTLGDNARAVKLAADSKVILTQIEVVKAALSGLQAQAKDLRLGTNIDPAKLLASEAALLGIEHVVENLGKKDVPIAGTAMGAFFSSMNRGSTAASYGWKILTGHITLMGGIFNKLLPKMFTSVAVWHLLIDAAIEILAVWAPAIIAVTAFGVAGIKAGTEVFHRIEALNTEMSATGRTIPALAGHFGKMAAAVRPEVYQLFGDALVVLNKRGGAFNTVAVETGRVLDQLAARFVFAITSGGGVNKFMEHAVTDVAKLGDSIGNLGGIFGAVFRAVPGYAEILLSVGDAITKVLEAAAQAIEPVIAVGLALHGFFIYGGLAVTVSLAMVAGIVKLIGAFGKFNEAVTLVGLNSLKAFALGVANGIKGAVAYGGALLSLAGSEGVAAAGSIALADAQTLLSRVPTIFWITLAASAIAGLVIWLRSAHSATQDFVSGLNSTIAAASLATVLTTIQAGQVATTTRLADAQRTLANTSQYVDSQNLHTGQSTRMLSQAWVQAQGNVDALKAAQKDLGDQYQLVSGRIGGLSKEYGGNTQALGALNLAGITTAQITDKNKEHWAQALIQVDATTQAYKAMGVQAGQLGNDLDVLGRTETSQYAATQKLNQAWSAFITDVTSTQGSFDTVAQGFSTLSDHSGTLKLSLGKLKVSYADTNAAIDSLTPAGIALNQAFGDQIGNIDKLFASWRTAGLANNLFISGVKDAIAPMTKYAAGSQEATAQLVALAQEAGYQGPISLQALNKWLGNTHGATKRLKDITNQATVQEALLTGAMQAQGSFIASKLLGDINNAILAYSGVEKAVSAYGTAVAQSGKNSDAAHTKMVAAISAIVMAEVAMGDNTSQMAAIVAKTFGISMPAAIALVRTAMGNLANKTLPGAQSQFRTFAEVGLGFTKTKADDLWNQLANKLGPKMDGMGNLAAGPAKAKFIDWATNGLHLTKTKATELWQELVTLQTHINNLHGKAFTVTMQANGFVKITEGKATFDISKGAWFSPHAAGGFIDLGTGPTADDVPAMLSKGEYVHKAAAVSQYGVGAMDAVNQGKATIAYAAGGVVGPQHLAAGGLTGKPSTWPDQAASALQVRALADTNKAGLAALTAATKAAIKLALAAGLNGNGSAIVRYAESFLGKIPYVFGGNSLTSGIDCSGFTQQVYGHFGIHAPRTSESQFAWAMKSPPVPGALAFYVSPAGGPPPGHVAIVADRNNVVSQGGGMGPTMEALNFLPLMGTGVPRGGLPTGGGGGNGAPFGAGPMTAQQIEGVWMAAGGPGGIIANIAQAITGPESNRNSSAVQQGQPYSTTGWGLWQITPGNSEPQAGVDAQLLNPQNNAQAAVAKYTQAGFSFTPWTTYNNGAYRAWLLANGGLVPKLAGGGFTGDPLMATRDLLGQLTPGLPPGPPELTGGQIRARTAKQHHTAFRKILARLEKHEIADYAGLRHAFTSGPERYLTKTTMSELGTLGKRQAAEQLAYARLAGSGLSRPNLAHLGAAARAEHRTASDKALNRLPGGHPGWASGLRYWLGQLGTASKVPVFDRGGVLHPGPNLTWNATGRPEHLVPAGSGEVHIHVHNHGVVGSRMELENWLVKSVDIARRKGRI